MTEENVYGGNQKVLQHQGSGTIPALADEELMGEDDEYDDLYSDVNVGESFFQAHNQPQTTPAQVGNTGNASLQGQNVAAEPRMAVVSGGVVEGKYRNDGGHNGINGPDTRSDVYPPASSFGAKGLSIDMQSNKVIPQGSTSVVLNSHGFSGNAVNVPEMPAHNSYGAPPQGSQQIPVSQMNVNSNVMMNKSPTQPFVVDNGNTMLFVGELHWWTTDAEIESILSQYGRVKEIKFFDERVSGKSKGYCQVEFYDSSAAAACKEGMNGYIFNGKACVVAFASPETLKQMGANFTGRNQGQNQVQNRRPLNEGMGRGNNNNNNNNNMNTQNGDGGRNYGRGGFARGGQGMGNRGGPWGGGMRGRGLNNMASGSGAGPYGPGLAGPAFGGMMHPQSMMGAGGFDPTFMGRGGGYGGYSGLAFPGMPHSYPGVNAMGMVGIAPHVNPAFFGTGMGTMGSSGMNGVHAAAMWSEANGGGGEEGGSEYGGYEDETQEKEEKPSREKERATTEREWSENSGDRRHKSHREEKDSHREYKQQRDRDSDEFDRGQSSVKSRSRSRMSEDDHRSRSRDADYGKRRRGD
ncbi:Glycine-rich RNA-binding protein GRP1A [Cardamine amara subsp. amara]|uniref:Glycine-rich RNA-binding protein GRP1A n=1 Tax=Cardamine amara subsp. amara TaxID=228776 RepID=A0ABD1BIN1_CARAN